MMKSVMLVSMYVSQISIFDINMRQLSLITSTYVIHVLNFGYIHLLMII